MADRMATQVASQILQTGLLWQRASCHAERVSYTATCRLLCQVASRLNLVLLMWLVQLGPDFFEQKLGPQCMKWLQVRMFPLDSLRGVQLGAMLPCSLFSWRLEWQVVADRWIVQQPVGSSPSASSIAC